MKRHRRRRQLLRIDLKPFVSIALLLITFFIWIKQTQRPVVISGHLPVKCKCEYDEQFTATLFLLDHNRVGLLRYGPAKDSADYVETDYSAGGLRTQLAVITQADPTKRIAFLLVPMPQATVKNIVDVIDELLIQRRVDYVLTYGSTDRENRMIANYQHYKRTNPQQSVFVTLLPSQWYF